MQLPSLAPDRPRRLAARARPAGPSAADGSPAEGETRGRGRRWPWLSWKLSGVLFAVPVVLVLVSIAVRLLGGGGAATLSVVDGYSGAPLAGVRIEAGDAVWTTDERGQVEVPVGAEGLAVSAGEEGYAPAAASVAPESTATLALRPTTLSGRLTDAASGGAIGGARLSLLTDARPGATVAAADDGSFRFSDVPAGARLKIEAGDYGTREEAVGDRTRLDLALPLAVVSGVVRDAAGEQLAGARVATADGGAVATTAADGAFRLVGPTAATELVVSAPGFGDQRLTGVPGTAVEGRLEPVMIRSIYANLGVLTDRARLDRLIEIAETTEINAIVIDVKQDTIYYDTQVPFFRDVPGMVAPSYDPAALVAELKGRGIYTIARMVVFKDPVLAEGRPDLAVRDEVNGGLWRDMNGAAWVNAFNEELWQANAELAVELAGLGFDEIQYDYIRFPSDGDLRTADFGNDYREELRRGAIAGAVGLAAERLRPTGAKFAVDLFPIIALFGNDQGIGQTLEDLVPLVDYVCLMIYPSHFELGNIPVDGHPNDFPAETVTYTLDRAEEMVPGSRAKMRPWLQDFTYPLEGYSAYGPDEVRAQIDAAETWGTSGWILWNAAGKFEVTALRPEG